MMHSRQRLSGAGSPNTAGKAAGSAPKNSIRQEILRKCVDRDRLLVA